MKTRPARETDHPEELLDLVDREGRVIETATREKIYKEGLRNYRAVHAFIKNSEGKLWIPRRVSTKKLYPDGLDYSIAGHVESGETYDEALLKEAREEANLDLRTVSYKELLRVNPYTHNVHCFQRVYEIESDQAPTYNTDDFSDYEWLHPEEIISRFESGEVGKEDIPETVKLCYL